MNIITLCGRLGRDAEGKVLESGQRVVNLNLATSRKRTGNEETLWWRITLWGDQFKKMEPYLKKGSALMVVGSMQYPRIYQDQNGTNQISLEVTAHNISFNPFRPEEETQGSQAQTPSTKPQQQGQAQSDTVSKAFDEKYAFKDDEIPF
jgi:single-strand DNA-binding protein